MHASLPPSTMMSSPLKKQPDAVADRVLKRAEISKVWASFFDFFSASLATGGSFG